MGVFYCPRRFWSLRFFLLWTCCLLACIGPAQAQSPTNAGAFYDLTTPIGLHHLKLQAPLPAHTNSTGSIFANRPASTNRPMTILDIGMNYQDDSGQFRPAEELIEAFPDGAVARKTALKVTWNSDINVAGAVKI